MISLKRIFPFCFGLLSSCIVIASYPGFAKPSAIIQQLGVQQSTATQATALVFTTSEQAESPSIDLAQAANGRYRLTLKLKGYQLNRSLLLKEQSLNQALSQSMATFLSMAYFEDRDSSGQPTVSLVLESTTPIQPHVETSQPNQLVIQLNTHTNTASSHTTGIDFSANNTFTSNVPLPTSTDTTSTSLEPATTAFATNLFVFMANLDQFDPMLVEAWQMIQAGETYKAKSALEKLVQKKYTKALATTPNGLWSRFFLADTLRQLNAAASNKYAPDISSLQNGLLQQAFYPAYLQQIQFHLQQKQPQAAQQILDKALTLWPKEPSLQHYKALLAELNASSPSAAQQILVHSLTKNPAGSLIRYRLALMLMQSPSTQATARQLLEGLLSETPDNPLVLKALGYLSQKSNDILTAKQFYEEALRPDLLMNYATLTQQAKAKAMTSEDTDRIYTFTHAAELLSPENADIRYNAAMIYLQLKDSAAAKKALTHFIQLQEKTNPNDSRLTKARQHLQQLGTLAKQ